MEEEELFANAETYASLHGRRVGIRLGFGIHGSVFVIESQSHPDAAGETALKVHHFEAAYRRERDVYYRLREEGISKILGFHVPQLIRHDDFPDNVWEHELATWKENFGPNWSVAEAILNELEGYGIFMVDPSPSNLRFASVI